MKISPGLIRKTLVIFAVLFFIFSIYFYLNIKKEQKTLPHYSREELMQMLDKKTPSQVLAILREEIISDESLANSCHGVAHEIGHHAYLKYGFSGAMSYEDDVCGAGYIHGVIEEKFGFLKEDQLLNELNSVCLPANLNRCFHGVGHGLMFALNGDVKKSLSFCDSYKEKSQRSNCYDGVFMHIFDDENTGINKVITHFEDAFDFCSTFKTPYNNNCYFYAPRYKMSTESLDNIKKCESITSSSLRVSCIVGSGVGFMKHHITQEKEGENYCFVFKNVDACFEGLIRYYNFHNELVYNSPELCQNEAIKNKNKCYNVLKHMVAPTNVSQ
ncbi:hypothetical protein K8Q94_02425 [Candidatus Nomurabacteria bacterium]|nr:hypothetical protein [Candidatus Nomurabacteria bacterium]